MLALGQPEERLGELVRARVAVPGVGRERPLGDGDEIRRDAGHPQAQARFPIAAFARRPVEQRTAAQHLEKNDSAGEHVGPLVGLAAPLLGRHVRGGAGGQRFPPRAAQRLRHVGQPEVEDLHLAVLAEKHVSRLEIAVDHAGSVRVCQTATDLHQDRHRLLSGQRAPLQATGQRLPQQELEDEIGSPLVRAVVVDGDDVGVIQLGGRLCLAMEDVEEPRAVDGSSTREPVRTHELDRDVPAELGVAGLKHDPEAALTERPDELEPADGRAGRNVGKKLGS